MVGARGTDPAEPISSSFRATGGADGPRDEGADTGKVAGVRRASGSFDRDAAAILASKGSPILPVVVRASLPAPRDL
jgi:hypothetical protein